MSDMNETNSILKVLDYTKANKEWFDSRDLVAVYHSVELNGQHFGGQRDPTARLKKLGRSINRLLVEHYTIIFHLSLLAGLRRRQATKQSDYWLAQLHKWYDHLSHGRPGVGPKATGYFTTTFEMAGVAGTLGHLRGGSRGDEECPARAGLFRPRHNS
jgi:hypothetical protein